MELADKLLTLRKMKGWTQAQAAKHIAIQQSYLSKLENGHYQPSAEVLAKLCLAYEVQESELISAPTKQRNNSVYWFSAGTIGLLLMVNGYFSLFFSQTYYTYQAQRLGRSPSEVLNIDYHLTDTYQGDKYIEMFYGVNYEFSLVATREVTREENRWLMSLGLCLFMLPTVRVMYKKLH